VGTSWSTGGALTNHSINQPLFRGLRRRRHLGLPTDKLTCGCQLQSQNPLTHSLVASCNQLRSCLRLRSRYTSADPIATASNQLSVVESLQIHRQIRLGVKQFTSTLPANKQTRNEPRLAVIITSRQHEERLWACRAAIRLAVRQVVTVVEQGAGSRATGTLPKVGGVCHRTTRSASILFQIRQVRPIVECILSETITIQDSRQTEAVLSRPVGAGADKRPWESLLQSFQAR